jgi:hypothetical protein
LGAAGGLTLTGGTVTASAPLIDATQTWNNASNIFVGLRFTATNTASDLGSDLMQLRVGSTTMFNVRRDGAVAAADSFYCNGATMQGNAFRAGSSGSLTFTSGSNGYAGSSDTALSREAAGVFRMTAPAAGAAGLLLYNTTTTATNYERGFLRWSSNVLQIGTEKLGTGTARNLELQTDGATRVTIQTGGLQVAGGATIDTNAFRAGSNGALIFTSGTNGGGGSYDTELNREAAGVFRIRSQAGAATGLVLYNTFAITTNWERAFLRWSSDVLQIGSEKLGTGSARALAFQTDGTTRINISATGGIGFYGAAASAQPAAVADATDAASVITQLNALLSRLRTVGIIAT